MPASRVSTTVSGKTWLEGNGTPSPTLGSMNNYYLDRTGGNVFLKTALTTWTLVGNMSASEIVGKWTSGSGAPDAGASVVGDFYLDIDSGLVYEKTAEDAWTQRADLTPPGAVGVWTASNGIPGAGLGSVGDFYLDLASSFVYEKTNETTWTKRSVTPTVTGIWLAGTGAPAGSLGNIGDYYEDTAANGKIYRKTGASTWIFTLTNKIDSAEKGAIGGVATLDATGKVPTSQLPDAVLGAVSYQGVWDASGGVYPSASIKGQYWVVSVPGTLSGTPVAIGDWLVYNGTSFDTIDHSFPVITGVWTAGNGTPTNSSGSVGDFYLNTANGNVYEKTAVSTWTIRGDLSPEIAGVWHSGSGTPAGVLGSVNDFYVNTDNGNVYEKTAVATWTIRGDLSPDVSGVWHSGSGVPDGALGLVNDFYVNTASGEVYEKTDAATWTLRGDLTPPAPAAGGFIVLPGGSVLTGTYDASVSVSGNATFDNVTVKGDLFIQGALTPVNPDSTLVVGGNFRANQATFGDNTGVAVVPDIKGDITVVNSLEIWGVNTWRVKSITQTSLGGSVNISVDTEVAEDLIVHGGISLVENDDGRFLYVGGNLICLQSIDGSGFSSPSRKSGATIIVSGDLRSQNVTLNGLANSGGDGGSLTVRGNASIYALQSVGALFNTGTGGNGGNLVVDGNMACLTIELGGGAGLQGGQGGSITIRGNLSCEGNIDKSGGTATGTAGGNASAFFCGGDAVIGGHLDAWGGAGPVGGEGAAVSCFGNLLLGQRLNVNGANASAGAGGNGGDITVFGNLQAFEKVTSEGGYTTGDQSGRGGDIYAGGNLKVRGIPTNTDPIVSTRGGALYGSGSGIYTTGRGGDITVGLSLTAICTATDVPSKSLGVMTCSRGWLGGGYNRYSSGRGGVIKVGQDLLSYVDYLTGTGLTVNTSTAQPDSLMGNDGAIGGDAGSITVGGDLYCGAVHAFGGGIILCDAGKGGNLVVGGDVKATAILLLSCADQLGNEASCTTYQTGGSCTVGGNLYVPSGVINLVGSASGSLSAYLVSCGICKLESKQSGNPSGSLTTQSDFYCSGALSQRGADSATASGGNAVAITVRGNLIVDGAFTRYGGAGSGAGGNVEALTVHGNLIVGNTATWEGGGATVSTNTSGGSVATSIVRGNAVFRSTFTRRGGAGAGVIGPGGNANAIEIWGNLYGLNMNSYGGAGSQSGSGGFAYGPQVYGTTNISGCIITGGAGGSSGNGGQATGTYFFGPIYATGTIALTGGNGGASSGMGGAASAPMFGSAAYVNSIIVAGGNSPGGTGGGGAVPQPTYNAPIFCSGWNLTGGSCTGGGQGGQVTAVTFNAPVRISNFNLTAGASSNGAGGVVAAVTFEGFFRGNITIIAGNSGGSSYGGNATGVSFRGGANAGLVSVRSGNGVYCGTNGGAGLYTGTYDEVTITDGTGSIQASTTLFISGSVTIGTLTTPNRATMYILHSNASPVVLKIRALVGRSVFRNQNATDTADQVGTYTTRLYTSSTTVWQYTALTAA